MKRKFIRISWMLALAGSMFFSFAGTSCSDDNDVEIPQPVTAVAAHTITITYDANGGSGSIEPVTISSGDKIVISDGTGLTAPAGKGFGGWSTSPDKEELDLSKLSGDITLYAVWKDILTITYDANGGTGSIEPVTFVSGWKTELSDGTGLTAPEGMAFRGWSMSKDKVEEVDFYKLNSSTTVYAVWLAKYIITYDANGGSGKISPQYFAVGDEITLADGNKFTAPKGKVFDSWSSSSNEVVSVDVASLNGDVTLYAVWKEDEASKGEVDLTQDGFYEWNDWEGKEIKSKTPVCAYKIGEATDQPYGDPSVNNYIDLSAYMSLEVIASDGTPRFCLNRTIANGQAPDGLIDIPNDPDQTAAYQTTIDNGDGTTTYIIDLAKIVKDKGFAHLHAIKGRSWGATVIVKSMKLKTPIDLTADGFYEWNDWEGKDIKSETPVCAYKIGEATDQPYGDPSVNNYIDLSDYKSLRVIASDGTPRFCLNRTIANGQAPNDLIDIPNDADQTAAYQTTIDNGDGTTTYIIDLAKIVKDKGFAHLHAIKGRSWGATVVVKSMQLVK